MLSVRPSILVAAATSFVTLSLAYDNGFGGIANELGRVGPYNANSEEWLQAVDASNSTGLFNISGYDVTKPWPGSAVDGWTLSVAAIDLSAPVYEPSAQRMVGYSMTIKAPDAYIEPGVDGAVNVDPSWGLCLWNWETPTYDNRSRWNNPDKKPLATNGSCAGLLSDACIAALEKQATTNYYIASETYGDYNSSLVCQEITETPSECGEVVGNGFTPLLRTSGLPMQYLNGTVTESDGWELTSYGEYANATQQDIEDMWDSDVLNFFPVLTLFVHMTGEPEYDDIEPGFAKMQCIAPDGTGTGKRFAYSDDGADDASSSSSSSSNGTSGTNADGSKSMAGVVAAPWQGLVLVGIAVSMVVQGGLL